ncbi:MAG TPA: DNA polymerase, partial [Thermoanaerobaculia bacterium]|nr:DNA polymerase [Thermoanaerobaculia bacterium]
LEACYRVGADRGADPETGKPFDDYDFDRIDSFKRIRRCGYVECIVSIPRNDDVPESYFPPLPVVRDSEESGEILFWPTGDAIYGWWCYEELRSLLEVPGARLCAVRQSVWFRGEPLFREFIDTLYTERKRSDGAKKQLLKILMNGSYGKTLQNPLKRRVLRLQRHEERPKGWLPTNPNPPDGDDFNWPWGTIQEYREAPFFLPHWGSLITARARMVIWKICVDVERGKYGKGKHVSYLDTDSCYTTAKLEEDASRLGALKLEYQIDEDKRKKTLGKLDDAWAKYQKRYEENAQKIETDASLSRAEKKELKRRLDARLRYYKEEHYESEKDSPKYARARPEGIVSCEFYGPKLYIVKDPVTGAEVKTVHKGSPEPNSEKLRRFLSGEPISTKAKAPKAGAGIRDDFQFDPVVLTRTGQKILWKKPKANEREIMHKRVHHHDPSGDGRTSPRHLLADQEFEVEESFRSRHASTAAKIYEEWTGALWEENLASAPATLASA